MNAFKEVNEARQVKRRVASRQCERVPVRTAARLLHVTHISTQSSSCCRGSAHYRVNTSHCRSGLTGEARVQTETETEERVTLNTQKGKRTPDLQEHRAGTLRTLMKM